MASMALQVTNTQLLVLLFTLFAKKKLLQEELNDDFFVQELKKNIAALDEPVDDKVVHQMMKQGNSDYT